MAMKGHSVSVNAMLTLEAILALVNRIVVQVKRSTDKPVQGRALGE